MNRKINSLKFLKRLTVVILFLFTSSAKTQHTNPWTRQDFIPVHPRYRNSMELRLDQGQSGTPFQRFGDCIHTSGMDTVWVRHYASGLAPSSDAAIDLVMDDEKNVIVTGYSVGFLTGRDILTIKYDSDGNQLWTARYNGPADNWDDARAVDVDDHGNVYVTGISYGGDDTGYDFVTIKYDPEGEECWAVRYNGTGSDWDEPYALVVHDKSITITGESAGPGSFSDYLTIRYDTGGKELFTARYNDSASGWDIAYDLAVDAHKNVYVTGQSWDLFTDFDFLTIKYDSTGNLLWTNTYNGSGNYWDVANGIVLDRKGNPVITGSSYHIANGFDMVTIKYDSIGNEIWTAAYSGPGANSDAAYALSLDEHGNTYITGISQISGTDYDCITSRIDSLGNIVWTELYNGPGSGHDAGYDLTVYNGNITVAGPSQGLHSDLDYMTIRYDSSGSEQWIYRHDGPAGRADSPYGIIMDDDHAIITGGTRGTKTLLDYTTIRLDGSGNEIWASTYTGPGHALDEALALGIDSNGNIIVTGTSVGSENNLDITTVQYDSLGNRQWISRYNGPGNGDDIPHAMVLDTYGEITITGESEGVDTEEDIITIKYNTDGEEIWSTAYSGPGNGRDSGLAVATDTLGNIVVTGESSGSGSKLDAVTIKYGPPQGIHSGRCGTMAKTMTMTVAELWL